MAQLVAGAVVDGKYRIDGILGRGGMGVVVHATHVQLGEKVALKFVRYRAAAGAEELKTRFKREAKVSAKLRSEHIARVNDLGLWRDRIPYMVMDYVEGEDLRHMIKTLGPFPVALALDYTVQLCVGIAEAHALGIVHRDLKPSNLIVTRRADGSDLLKILDFGVSKWRGESELEDKTQEGVVLGSPKYMAPEQLFGAADVDARADIWSIGAILYEMFSGHPPYDQPTFTRICAEVLANKPPPPLGRLDISVQLEAAIMKCFERTPGDRHQNVAELAGAVLDAVKSPNAAAIRDKISSILASVAPTSAPSQHMGSLTPAGISSSSVRGTSRRKLGTITNTKPSAAVQNASSTETVQLMAPAEPAPATKGRMLPKVVAAAVLAVGLIAYVAFGRHDTKEAQGPSSNAHAASTVPVPPVASAIAAQNGPTPSDSASATPAASAITGAATPSATAATGPRATPRPGARPTPRPATPAATTAAVNAAPPPPPTPAPSPAPPTPTSPPKKYDPLGERQ